MSINPPLTELSQPILFPGEILSTSTSGAIFQVESGGGYPGDSISFYGSGNAYLTDLRIILVTQPLQSTGFQGLQLPLTQICGARLQSPFLGRKSIVGQVDLAVGAGLFEKGKYKVAFAHSGAEDFFQKLITDLEQVRRDPPGHLRRWFQHHEAQQARASAGSQDKQAEGGPRVAFIDPENGLEVFVACDNLKK